MSTSTDSSSRTWARKSLPVYQRKRRRIYGGVGVAAILVIVLIAWAVTQGGGGRGAALPGFTIAYGQGRSPTPTASLTAIRHSPRRSRPISSSCRSTRA